MAGFSKGCPAVWGEVIFVFRKLLLVELERTTYAKFAAAEN
jgi:hypothetical protein